MVTASPQPPRVLTSANLIGPEQVPSDGAVRVGVAAPGLGRPPDQISPCIPRGLSELGAIAVLSRNFSYLDPAARGGVGRAPSGSPTPQASKVPPSIYTSALQFASEAEARQAFRRAVAWRDRCEVQLGQQGYTVRDRQAEWVPVPANGPELGRFALLRYTAPGDRAQTIESFGLTRVGDRVMLIVAVPHGATPDPTPGQRMADQQAVLIKAAAGRLAR